MKLSDDERTEAAERLARLVRKGTRKKNYPWIIYKIERRPDAKFPYHVMGKRTRWALASVFSTRAEAEAYIIRTTSRIKGEAIEPL